MRRSTFWVLAIVAATTFSPSVHACRVMQSPQKRISDVYSDAKDIQVALVPIVEARQLSSPIMKQFPERFRSEETPWRAAAVVTQVIVGEGTPEIVVFDRGWGRAACDDGTAMPSQGDRWIAYYQRGTKGEANVVATYPLRVAQEADPRVRGNVR